MCNITDTGVVQMLDLLSLLRRVNLAMTAEGGGHVKVANYNTTEPVTEAAR